VWTVAYALTEPMVAGPSASTPEATRTSEALLAVRAYWAACAATHTALAHTGSERDAAEAAAEDAMVAAMDLMGSADGGWELDEQLEELAGRLDVGATAFRRSPVASLSGGERKRVALAAALAQRADVLLLDEPNVPVGRCARRASQGSARPAPSLHSPWRGARHPGRRCARHVSRDGGARHPSCSPSQPALRSPRRSRRRRSASKLLAVPAGAALAVSVETAALGIPAGAGFAVLVEAAVGPIHSAVLGLLVGHSPSPCRSMRRSAGSSAGLQPFARVPTRPQHHAAARVLRSPCGTALAVLVEAARLRSRCWSRRRSARSTARH
jgi:hypothetical protein